MQRDTVAIHEETSSSNVDHALVIRDLQHRYGENQALDHLTLSIAAHTIHGILGPNGSGKSTLFRLTSTLTAIQAGSIHVFETDVATQKEAARRQLGIVFQSPSLDGKLTVMENIRCQATLYGLVGKAAELRIGEVMQMMGIEDRAKDYCEHLSGGLKRRVELAKGMLHRPRLLLLDEPSTGLDPAARLDLWHALSELRSHHGVTVVMTTHLLEEAEKCDQLSILHQGRLVAQGTADSLRREAGEAILRIVGRDPSKIAAVLLEKFGLASQIAQQEVRLSQEDILDWIPRIAHTLDGEADSITIARPSLEDVFVARTGHRFWGEI